jgi:hypothetical protein
MSDILSQMLEKDKVNTGATGEEKKEEVKTEIKEEVKIEAEAKIEVKDEPKKEEPKIEEKKAEAVNEYWKEFGVESPEALKELINSKKEEKVAEVKPKFADATVESYNNWVLNGGVADFGIFQTVNKFSVSENPTTDEMVKALVLKEVLEYPEYKGEEAILERKFKKQYALDIPEDAQADMDDDEKAEAKLKLIDLKREFKKTADGFKELQSKSTPKVDEALEIRLKDNPIKLKEHLDKEVPTLSYEVPKRVKGEKGELNFADSLYNIKFDPTMQENYRKLYETFAKENNFPDLGDGSHEGMKKIAMGLTIAENLDNLFNDVFEAGLALGKSDSVKEEIKDTNPTATGTHEKRSTSSEKTDKSGDIFKK